VSEQTQERIDQSIRALVMGAFDRATALLTTHRAILDQGAAELLQHETLDEPALRRLTAGLAPATT
jgi:cell division protease FtsH